MYRMRLPPEASNHFSMVTINGKRWIARRHHRDGQLIILGEAAGRTIPEGYYFDDSSCFPYRDSQKKHTRRMCGILFALGLLSISFQSVIISESDADDYQRNKRTKTYDWLAMGVWVGVLDMLTSILGWIVACINKKPLIKLHSTFQAICLILSLALIGVTAASLAGQSRSRYGYAETVLAYRVLLIVVAIISILLSIVILIWNSGSCRMQRGDTEELTPQRGEVQSSTANQRVVPAVSQVHSLTAPAQTTIVQPTAPPAQTTTVQLTVPAQQSNAPPSYDAALTTSTEPPSYDSLAA